MIDAALAAMAGAVVEKCGEMAEWFKAAVLKTAVGVSLPWVRIPLSPPSLRKLLIGMKIIPD